MSEKLSKDEEQDIESESEETYQLEDYEVGQPEHFHIVVEEEGNRKIVPNEGAVSMSIETIYVVFSENVEGMLYVAPLSCAIEPSTTEQTSAVHTIRTEGDSEWGHPWAVEVTFEERPGGWLSPTQLRYEGLAEPAPFHRVLETEVENNKEVFEVLF